MTVCPAVWGQISFSLHGPHSGSQRPGCRQTELRWLYPCVQSGAGSVSWQYITLLILLHGLRTVPTYWDAFNSCADFDLFFFLVLLGFICDLCKKQPKLRRISKLCWCLPYGDLSWDIFFLDFSDIFTITIPIWLVLLCVFQWEFIFCFSKICHRDYP